jgi:thioredoxin 1
LCYYVQNQLTLGVDSSALFNKETKMSEVLHINDADFETTVVQSDIPVLVDFWAPWCGPCKMIAPILDEIAPEFAGKAKIVKINVDDNQLVAGQFGIRSIPTLLLFKNGQLVATQVGALPKNQLAAFINQHL